MKQRIPHQMNQIIQKAKSLHVIHLSQFKILESLLWDILVYKQYENFEFLFFEGQIGMSDLDKRETRPVLIVNQNKEREVGIFINYLNSILKAKSKATILKSINYLPIKRRESLR